MASKETKELVDTTTGEVVIVPADAIKAVNQMDATEYMAWLASENLEVVEFDGGSDWTLVGDKSTLIDVPFVIAMIRFNHPDTGQKGKFASVCCYTEDGKKIVFNDGGTGVYRQLLDFADKHGRTTGIMCSKGLRRSDYKFTDDEGVERDATTYYIA